MRKHYISRIIVGVTLSLLVASPGAEAHWCDSLWASSYNLVIRPETSLVTVPATGSATLNAYVQNNMGYPLINFDFGASLSGATVSAVLADSLKVGGTLLPGEKAKIAITVTKAGGGTVSAQDINYSIKFGGATQSRCYPTGNGAKIAAIVYPNGTVYPEGPMPGIGILACTDRGQQAISLVYSAVADFESESGGLDKLMGLYCAGRASWNNASSAVIPSYCPNATSTASCPARRPTANGTKYDYAHLWTAGELAVRKSALGNRLPTLRARLRCGVNDDSVPFAGYALFVLGYLGDDMATRTFLQSKVADANLGLIAKAALYLAGNPSDKTSYRADVEACLTSTDFYAKIACAGALGIADRNDEAVQSTLIPNAKFTQPDTDDNGKGLYASHLLELVAWDRRGWAVKGGDTGGVSFYGDVGSTGRLGTGGANGTGDGGAGGVSGHGGTVGSGSAIGTGGSRGTGGVPGTGGRNGTDGTRVSGGTTGAGGTGTGGGRGTTTAEASDTNSCQCGLGAHARRESLPLAMGLLAVAGVVARRRNRSLSLV